MNSTGNNDWRRNGSVGVAERETGQTQDPFVAPYGVFDDDDKDETDAEERRPGGKRKRLIGVAIFFLILIFAGAGLWMMFSDGARTRVNVPVRDNAQRIDQAARGGDDATAQAIAEVRGATATPSPAVSASPVPGRIEAPGGTRTIIVPTTPVTVPIDGVGDSVSVPTTGASTGQQGGAYRAQTGASARSGG